MKTQKRKTYFNICPEKLLLQKKVFMDVAIEESWKNILQDEFAKPYFEQLVSFVKEEYQTTTIYPPGSLIFNAFNKCSFDDIKVVIIGQDPYHGPGQAHGLCFSVNEGIKIPPSLRNIYKELNSDIGKTIPTSGNLEHWANQGVLLLNATLTVRANQAGSHQRKGWETFTDAVIKLIAEQKKDVVFLLWGAYAIKKSEMINPQRHYILTAPHPSPLSASRGFLGCKHFSKTNEFLASKGLPQIDW